MRFVEFAVNDAYASNTFRKPTSMGAVIPPD
jgi:hypothetical protein